MKAHFLNMPSPLLKSLFTIEFVAAFTIPCVLLIFGTFFSLLSLDILFSPKWQNVIFIYLVVVGGYLGMIGVCRLLLNLLNDNATYVNAMTLFYTLIGCIAVIPLTMMMLRSERFIWALAGMAPILVAIQLLYMNRNDIRRYWKQRRS